MQIRNTQRALGLRSVVFVAAVLVALTLAACSGSGSSGGGNAQNLLRQTFSGSHTIHSGVLSFSLGVDPSGSSTFSTPVSLSLTGPFQSRGTGKLPESNFTIAIAGLGRKGSLGVISTGTSGYVTLEGTAYQLPASDFQRLESSLPGAQSGASGHGTLAGLGIDPMRWLTHPSVVGSDTIAGAPTTHIRAGVDVKALLADLSTFLGRTAHSTGTTKIPSSIPAATRQKIAAEIQNATVDIWTGASDRTLRRLALHLTVPVSGQISTLFGGLRAAGISLSLQYADLNRQQTISAPASVQPYSQLTAKLRGIASALEGGLGAAGVGSALSGGGATGGSSATVSKYSRCIERAGGDVLKMQKCSSLLNGG
ncbi:MAG: hypothetical protein ACRDMJ_15600 [Solirubrobacteraceae bacterium]